MRQNQPVTEKLAKWAAATSWAALPAAVAHQAKRSLMNFFAVALTGCRDATIETTLASLAAFSSGGRATVIGRRERLDALSAAFINAAGANVLDFCDTHVPTAIHPTAPIVPALLALAETQVVGGRGFLLALVIGQEVACRIGLAMSPSHYNKGWHITATCGVFGAAAGSGKLLGLGAEQMIWALGLAATQAAGLCECLGTPAKSVGVGNAARNGLWSALLAARDFAGPAEPLNGVQGYYHALGEAPDLSQLTRGLGETWEIMKTSYKPYPCGFVVHPVLDCVLDWRRDHPAAVVEKVIGHRQSVDGGACRPAGYFHGPRICRSACSTPLRPRCSLARPDSNNSPMHACRTRACRRCAARSAWWATQASSQPPPLSRSRRPTASNTSSRKPRRVAATPIR